MVLQRTVDIFHRSQRHLVMNEGLRKNTALVWGMDMGLRV